MIQILTRVRFPELYTRMQESAKETASGPIQFAATLDDGSPKLAESYNLLASASTAEILLFVHDDVIFLSHGWDDKIREAIRLGFNVIGAVGTQKYDGGLIFDSGKQYSVGKCVYRQGGKRMVKLMANRSEIEPVKVIDGMLMAVDAKHFKKTGFDWDFDGLFYYDVDFCLRSNCAVVDILVAHEKPAHLWGKYPENMKQAEHYRDKFNAKHGFKADPPIGDQRCDQVVYEDYVAVRA